MPEHLKLIYLKELDPHSPYSPYVQGSITEFLAALYLIRRYRIGAISKWHRWM
jgi:hypothetical protein